MKEFFAMGGYAFYVWTSMGIFTAAMLIDFFSLRNKDKRVRRHIQSFVRRKQQRKEKTHS